MPRYVALLRGINLGSRNKVAMADLRALFADLGFEDVSTYVQSGNVVFRGAGGAAKVRSAIEKRIKKDLGLDIPVLLRTRAEMAKVVERNQFLRDRRDPTKLHVTFLADKPTAARVKELDPEAFGADELHVAGREVYLHCPNGYGRSKLTNAFFEKRLGVTATTRNWKTVTTLAELASA